MGCVPGSLGGIVVCGGNRILLMYLGVRSGGNRFAFMFVRECVRVDACVDLSGGNRFAFRRLLPHCKCVCTCASERRLLLPTPLQPCRVNEISWLPTFPLISLALIRFLIAHSQRSAMLSRPAQRGGRSSPTQAALQQKCGLCWSITS